jgi:hypothetical protein
MKVKLLLVAFIVAVALLLGLSYRDYKNHKTDVANAAATTQQVNAELSAQRATNDTLITKYNALLEQCQKGVAAYTSLPAATAKTLTEPVCGISIVQ